MPGPYPSTATTGEDGDKNVAQLDLQGLKFRLGMYRHYKGGVYVVYGVSLLESNLEQLVHYYSIDKKTRWTRTMSDFCEAIRIDNTIEVRSRFHFMRAATWQELAKAAGFDELLQGLMTLAKAHGFVSGIYIEPAE